MSKAASEGGSRAASGIRFQTSVSAWFVAHLLTAQKLDWLDPLIDAAPVAVAAESAGPGDDLRIELTDGRIVEAQVKRGLSRGRRLWEALDALAIGIASGAADFGLLLTCPRTSKSILTHLARDLTRIGDGRTDQLSEIGETFLRRLVAADVPMNVCASIRIRALAATDVEGDAIRAGHALLRTLIAVPSDVSRAWELIERDCLRLIEMRGRRTLESALTVLTAGKIALRSDDNARAPALLLHRLADWAHKANKTYSIIGIAAPLAIDSSWLEQNVHILADPLANTGDFQEALSRYRDFSSDEQGNCREDAHGSTVGRFVRHAVVLAGPGLGKTTLLTKLARGYAADGLPVLKVRLRTLAERMRTSGCGFEEGLFELGCDKSGVGGPVAQAAGFSQWIVLCDGLDECGGQRADLARDLATFALAHPRYRIIVTSRTIGYDAGALAAWRHYALSPLPRDRLSESVKPILEGLDKLDRLDAVVAILKASPAIVTIASNPLLLGLATALALNQGSIGRTEADLYQRIFTLVEAAAIARADKAKLSDTELSRAINLIGHALIANPAEPAEATLDRAGGRFAQDFSCPSLDGRRRCELALNYWCEVGLVERIHYEGADMLAFVHKTFGEFACARFIRNAPAADRRGLLREAVALQADPVVDFAAALGLARDAFTLLLAVPAPWPSPTVTRALALLNHAQPEDVDDVIGPVLARAYELLRDASIEEMDRVGRGIVALAPVHGDAQLRAARSHLEDPSANVRIVAWTCMIDSGEAADMRDALLEAGRGLTVPSPPRAERELLLGGYGRRPRVSEILEDFTIKVADHLLGERDTEADAIVLGLCKHPSLSFAGFVIKLERVLNARDRSDFHAVLASHWYGEHQREAFGGLGGLNFDGYEQATDANEIAQLSALAGDAAPDPRLIAVKTSVLPQLSAYRELTDWGNTPASDVWHWRREGWRAVEREVIQAVIRLGVIDPDRIAIEAASLLAVREEICGHHRFALFQRTAAVDAPPLDWTAARTLPLDRWKIEQAMRHGSEFLLRLAVNLLGAMSSEAERLAIVERALDDGEDDTLWGAAQLAKGLPVGLAVPRILDRLERDTGVGTEYLFETLTHHPLIPDARVEKLFTGLLTAARPQVASAAATTLAQPGRITPKLRLALVLAFAYWGEHPVEPRHRQVVAPDPRGEIANAMAAAAEPSDEELAAFVPFRGRSGLHSLSELVKTQWQASGSFRDAVFARAERGELSARDLSNLLDQEVPLDTSQRAVALRLASGEDQRMRRAMVKLLGWLDLRETCTALVALAEDEEAEIRDAAREILDRVRVGA